MFAWVRAAVVAAILLAIPGLLEPFEPPKAAAVRVLGLGALAAWLATSAWRRSFRFRTLDVAVAVWLLAELLTTITSVNPRLSLLGDTMQREGLLTSLGLVGIYVAARAREGDRRAIQATVNVVLGTVAVASAYAILQALRHDPVHWARMPIYAGAGPFTRPFSVLGHPNVLGVITAAAFAACVGLAFAGGRAWIRWALAGLFGAVTLVTLSRAACLGALVGGLVALGLGALRRRWLGPRGLAWAAGALAAAAVLVATTGLGRALGAPLEGFFHVNSGSASNRLELWRTALRAWQSRPWVGVGPDAFYLQFQLFQTPAYWHTAWGTLPAHAHSIYLQWLATRGLAGGIAGVALMVGLLDAAGTAWREAPESRPCTVALVAMLAALAVAGGFGALGISGAVLATVTAASLVSMGAPQIASMSRADRGREPSPHPGEPSAAAPRSSGRPSRRRGSGDRNVAGWPARAAIGLVVALALAWSAADLLGMRFLREGLDLTRSASRGGDPARAEAVADRATRLLPWDDVAAYCRAQMWLTLAEASPRKEAPLDGAETWARRAIALAPTRALNRQLLAGVWLARARGGDSTALPRAEQAFAEAQKFAPYNAKMMLQLADGELTLGRPQKALPLIRRALDLYPEQRLARRMLSIASFAANRQKPSEGSRADASRGARGSGGP